MYAKTKNFGKVYYYSSYREIDKTLPFIYFIHGAAQDHSIWTQYVRYFSNKTLHLLLLIVNDISIGKRAD